MFTACRRLGLRGPGRAAAIAIAIAATVLAGCATAPAPSTKTSMHISAIDAVVAEEMAGQKIPGLAVAVVQRGQVVRATGHGLAHIEHSVPVTASTVFQTGSLAKQLTAVAVMLQVEDGKLDLDGSITRYLPGAPGAWKGITVRHLLTHTSGIPNYDDRTLDYRKDYSDEELADIAFGLPLVFPAGSRWRYSDIGYMLLGLIVHKASGQFYGDVLRDRVFAPLGMSSARVISEADIVMHRAAGYRLAGDALKNQDWVAPALNTTADGSLYLSLQDWLVWEQALRTRAVLRASSWDEVFTPVRLNSGKTFPHGFGWELHDGRGPASYRHEGSWQGFQAAYLHAIDADLTVIVLANLAQARPMHIAQRLAQIFTPELKRPEPVALAEQDPLLTARVQALLNATAAGALRESEFEHLEPGFFPAVPAAYREALAGLGPVQRIEMLERWERGDDTVLSFRVSFRAVVGSKPFRVDLSVTPAGRFSSYGLRAEAPSE
jgi:CubicO group peptidase (beta-lactamase class C family)